MRLVGGPRAPLLEMGGGAATTSALAIKDRAGAGVLDRAGAAILTRV